MTISPDNLLSEEDYDLPDEEIMRKEAVKHWNQTAPNRFRGMLETQEQNGEE